MLKRATLMSKNIVAILGAGCMAFASAAYGQALTPIDTPNTPAANVFVEQIGVSNSGSVTQSSNRQKAAVSQDGANNALDMTQNDAGDHIAVVSQDGDDNEADVTQSGNGQAIANLSQTGVDNVIILSQTDNGVLGTAAEIVQSGANNMVDLEQSGTDNQARLIQNGDNNAMTARQLNSGNRLEWVQDGSNLSDMAVEQTGGQTMFIMQSNTGG